MATTIKGKFGFEVTGQLKGFDETTDGIEFKFEGGNILEIKTPNREMCLSLSQLGLQRLGDAVINFVTNRVELQKKTEKPKIPTGKQTVTKTSVGLAH